MNEWKALDRVVTGVDLSKEDDRTSAVLVDAKGFSGVVYRCRACTQWFKPGVDHKCGKKPDTLGRKLIDQMDMQKQRRRK